jgi:hypothetical protein
MLHLSRIYDIIEKRDAKKRPVEFSIIFVKKSTGEKVFIPAATCTSTSFRPRTINIMVVASGEIRKVRASLILAINETKIYI